MQIDIPRKNGDFSDKSNADDQSIAIELTTDLSPR